MSEIFDDNEDSESIDVPKREIVVTRRDATPLGIRIIERQNMALELRKQGGSYRAIAESMRNFPGISARYDHAQANRDVKAALAELINHRDSTAEEVRALMYEQLNDIVAAYFSRATERGDYFAADRVFGAFDRIISLFGLAKNNFGLDVFTRNVDMNKLSMEQLERVAKGEPLMRVLLDGPLTTGFATASEGSDLAASEFGGAGRENADDESRGSVHP